MKNKSFDYADYLASKKAIDDASLSPRVWQAFCNRVRNPQKPLRILEAGAGTGTMIIRLLEQGILQQADYTAVELEPAFRQSAHDMIKRWCVDNQCRFDARTVNDWTLSGDGMTLEIHWCSADLMDIGNRIPPASCNLLLAHAVVDLLPVPEYLPVLIDRLVPGGAFLFTINYAGNTRFFPEHAGDAAILEAYHHDMDQRFTIPRWRPSQTGRLLGSWLQSQGYKVLENGDSDWKLPSTDCPAAVTDPFVRNILDTMESALPAVETVADWLAVRRRQLSEGTLQFHAANRDYFGLKTRPLNSIPS